MNELLQAIESSSLASSLRGSIWVYPLVNAGHLIGIALLFGSVVALDLRVLGCWKDVELTTLERCLRPLAIVGLCIAVSCGLLLFSTAASDYAAMPLMRWKLALIAVALFNALLFLGLRRRDTRAADAGYDQGSRVLSLSAGLSLLLWLLVLLVGRLIGYR